MRGRDGPGRAGGGEQAAGCTPYARTVDWVVWGIVAVLGVVLLWGAVSPRSQWSVLTSWSVSDVHANEPGAAGLGWRRLINAIGVLGVLAVLGSGVDPAILQPARNVRAPSAVESMWGTPVPQLVDRIVIGRLAASPGVVATPVLGYQLIGDEPADYLREMRHFSMLGNEAPLGYVGDSHRDAVSVLASADLVVNVRGPLLCIPREVVVIETEKSVQIAVYYGLPDPADGTLPDNVASCPENAPITGSVLIPIKLALPVAGRAVQGLDGTSLPAVAMVR